MKFKAEFLRLVYVVKRFWFSVISNKTGSLSLLVAIASVYVAWQTGYTSNSLVERQIALQEAQYKPMFTTRWEQDFNARSEEGENFKEPLFILNQGGAVSVQRINLIFYLNFDYLCSFADEEGGNLIRPYRTVEVALNEIPYVLNYKEEYRGVYIVDFPSNSNDVLSSIKRDIKNIKGDSHGDFSLSVKAAIHYSDQTGSYKTAFIEGGRVEYDVTGKELVKKLLDIAFIGHTSSESIYSGLSEIKGKLCKPNSGETIIVKPNSSDVVKLL